ncbi:MAG: hypothetical protein EAZ53_04570 [Bacteroidetes bacterium]|nr:MAG: hypothetical protein EAZ53_04570 [Bacteroidota bacterium]
MNPKIKFLKSEAIASSIKAGLSTRNKNSPIYLTQNETEREKFKDFLKKFLEKMEVLDNTNKEDNYKLVLLLNQESKQFTNSLNFGELKIGVCQKIINLYLKYLWCLDLITEPPLMPLDGRVLAYFKNSNFQNWTEITDISMYKNIMQSIENQLKENTNFISLSQWELDFWNKYVE